MIDVYTQILNSATPFLEKVFFALQKDTIDPAEYLLDHLCYRVETKNRYDELFEVFDTHTKLLTVAEINGRSIATFKLHSPINFGSQRIFVIELPAPKSTQPYPEGYQHVEFVIKEDFTAFMKKYEHLSFDVSNQYHPTNPDIVIKYDDFAVKFHQHSLEYCIKYIQNTN